MKTLLVRLLRDSSGVSAIEYALLAALLASVIVIAVSSLGLTVLAMYTNIKDQVILALS
jgi:pilus assembly protein Flp/PilA